jgi:hypothetical protein
MLDHIESRTTKDDQGNDTTSWFMQVNPQFKHLNICLNQIDDAATDAIKQILSITPDDFQLTLSGNAFSDETILTIQQSVQ